MKEGWFPENVNVLLSKDWLGGKLWHYKFASRGRMLEYTLELEQKIIECRLASENTRFVLALCGEGFYWHKDQLEDFVEFYFTGRHRPDDALSNAETRSLTKKGITLSRSISLFACMTVTSAHFFPELSLPRLFCTCSTATRPASSTGAHNTA